jgi:hypothetical protein
MPKQKILTPSQDFCFGDLAFGGRNSGADFLRPQRPVHDTQNINFRRLQALNYFLTQGVFILTFQLVVKQITKGHAQHCGYVGDAPQRWIAASPFQFSQVLG